MPYDSATMTLTYIELELVLQALHESAQDSEQFDDKQQSLAYLALHRKFTRALHSLITH
jgi:hypothetical protein